MSEATKEKLDKLGELINHIKVAMMTTHHGDHMHSRPMGMQELDFEGDIWFFASDDSDKVHDIKIDPQVNLSFSDMGHNKFVSISGQAEIVRSVQKNQDIWTPLAKVWFPGGPEDPKLILIRVKVEHAEYWDGPYSKVVTLFSLLGSIITRKPFEAGENEQVDL